MTSILWQLFNVLGIDFVPPANFAAFIPWLLQFFLGISLIAACFKFFFSIPKWIGGGRF
ncbi:MAG: hypothetical protein RR145_05030 [Oscillospiraceae bacterium]